MATSAHDTVSLAHWNVNGWTMRNCELRSVIIHSLKLDIISINETHLVGEDAIDLEGYVWVV